jgi:hypothetical protein
MMTSYSGTFAAEHLSGIIAGIATLSTSSSYAFERYETTGGCSHLCKQLISLFSITIDCENSKELYFRPKKGRLPRASTIPGQKVSQGSYSAFVPAALPPELNWTPRLIGALSDADRLVGRLAGEGG